MEITLEQIKAARALKNWGQLELAARSHVSQVTIANIESGKSRGNKESLQAILAAFQNAGVEFIDNGVRLAVNSMTTIDGKDSYAKLLDDVFFSLRDDKKNAEVLFFGSDEKRSSPKIKASMRKLRQAGIRMRSLISKSNKFIIGPLGEYRELPRELTSSDVITIYGDKVAFLIEHTPHYRVLLVKNNFLTNDHKRIFEYFWNVGEQPESTTAKETYE